MGVFGRLRESLTRTKQQIIQRFDEIVSYADEPERRSRPIDVDTVVGSHFVAINAAIGSATGNDQVVIAVPDYCSQTVFDVVDGRLVLVERGFEAPDTLVR